MTNGHDPDAAPPQLTQAIKNLWDAGFNSEKAAFASAHFRMLYNVCAALYLKIPGSRLTGASKNEGDESHFDLTNAIRNFFRWCGAPWYGSFSGSVAPEPAAARLHTAFLTVHVNRTYLAPLDCLGLGEPANRSDGELRQACFGDAEIVLMDDEYIKNHLSIKALQRFGPRCTLPTEQLKDFYYLVVHTVEPAGPIWQRAHRGQMDWSHQVDGKTLSELSEDNINIYRPIYPDAIEDALFPVLLYLLNIGGGSKPFSIPWVYSITNDPFAGASLSPDPSSLSFTLVSDGPFEDPYEVPDRSNYFEFVKSEIEDALGERWQRLQSASARAANGNGNFHPLTQHFLIKSFAESGIDEVVALISCIEVTLMLPDERYTDKLRKRFKRLVGDERAYQYLKSAYTMRNKYLHALGAPDDATTFDHIATYRWAVSKAVDAYLGLADERSGEDRETLLRLLKR